MWGCVMQLQRTSCFQLSTAPYCTTSSILNGAFIKCMQLPIPTYEELQRRVWLNISISPNFYAFWRAHIMFPCNTSLYLFLRSPCKTQNAGAVLCAAVTPNALIEISTCVLTPFWSGPTILLKVAFKSSSKNVQVISLCSALLIFTGRQSGVVPGGRSSGWTLLAASQDQI